MSSPGISYDSQKGDFLNLSGPKRRTPKPSPVIAKQKHRKKKLRKSKKRKQNLTMHNSPPKISDKDPVLLNLYSQSFINLLTRPRHESNNSNSYLNNTYHPVREYYRDHTKTKGLEAVSHRHCVCESGPRNRM